MRIIGWQPASAALLCAVVLVVAASSPPHRVPPGAGLVSSIRSPGIPALEARHPGAPWKGGVSRLRGGSEGSGGIGEVPTFSPLKTRAARKAELVPTFSPRKTRAERALNAEPDPPTTPSPVVKFASSGSGGVETGTGSVTFSPLATRASVGTVSRSCLVLNPRTSFQKMDLPPETRPCLERN